MGYRIDVFSSEVLATYDYDKFKLIKGNRRIDLAKVLIKSVY